MALCAGCALVRTAVWPYAHYDVFDYVYWPYAYDDFWPYAYDDFTTASRSLRL